MNKISNRDERVVKTCSKVPRVRIDLKLPAFRATVSVFQGVTFL